MSAPNSAKVLRVAVIVDGESCEELHQTEPADVSIIRGAETAQVAGPTLAVETGIAAEGTPREQLLPKIMMAIGLVMLIVGSLWFAFEVDKYVDANAVLTKVDTEAAAAKPTDASSTIALLMALLGVVPLMTGRTMLRGARQRRKQQITVYDGWTRPHDYRKRAPIWLGIGVIVTLAGFGLFAFEVSSKAPPTTEIADAKVGDMRAFKASEQESGTGGLGLFILLLGIVPVVVGVMGLGEEPVAPPKRTPKGGHAPRQHRLFEWVESEGSYYIDIPPETRGKIALGSNSATIEQLRKRFGQGDKLRIKLGSKAKGKLLIGQTKILFQTAKPVAEAAKPPFPTEYIDPFVHLRLSTLDAIAVGSSAVAALLIFVWFGYIAERTPPKPDERFIEVMGLPASFYEEEEEVVEEEVKEDVLKQKDEKEEEDKKEEEELDEKLDKPDNVSDAAFREARGVGVARVLGTYGGVGEGTVLDVIEGTENNLGELFAQGMSTTAEYQGGEIGDFVAGGGGINATGTMASNEGMQTGEGPAEVGATVKKERKVKAQSTTDDVIGDVDKKSVAATIRRRMPGLEACYEKALRSNANLKGKMTYTITVNPSGRVTDVKIEEDTVGDSSVRSCTEAKIKGWRFVSEGAEESSEVTFSVAFTG
jgi:hypothetical protein